MCCDKGLPRRGVDVADGAGGGVIDDDPVTLTHCHRHGCLGCEKECKAQHTTDAGNGNEQGLQQGTPPAMCGGVVLATGSRHDYLW